MLPTLNYDAILSDPLLILAGVFLIAGPLVFLVSVVKLVLLQRKQKQDADYNDLNPFSPFPPAPEPEHPSPEVELPTPAPYMQEASNAPIAEELVPPIVAPSTPVKQPDVSPSDKTVILPSGMGELQGQLEIAFSQIKTLSKKVAQMESELESVARNVVGRLDKNELKEVPMNPGDFTQKLLKLAEHVIVLEKEVERLKTGTRKDTNGTTTVSTELRPETTAKPVGQFPTSPSGSKPPMMPL